MLNKILFKVRLKLIYLTTARIGCIFIGGHFIYNKFNNINPIIIDLGANKGIFSCSIAEKYNCICLLVEANPVLFAILPKKDNFLYEQAAITNIDSPIHFSISNNDEASSINSAVAEVWSINSTITVQGLTFDSLLKRHSIDKIDLLKIDIEGAEINVLNSISDQNIKSIPQITMEFHEFLDSTLREPTFKTINRICKLGFYMIVTSTDKFAEVLFINKNLYKFNILQKANYYLHRMVSHSIK